MVEKVRGVLLPMAFYTGVEGRLRVVISRSKLAKRQILGSRIKVLILCLEMLETSALGLGQDLGSRLIRLVWLEPSISPRTIFKPLGSADQKLWFELSRNVATELRLERALGRYVATERNMCSVAA
ncbi:hypothetical protein DY000_02012776 [Brassica cretica]|uniref:Uncharacterized protein n=1 Tax=Brassica cretica TaxID=69181 RepID=A0ABQ7DAN0_BRACR|nr:hypothetical protein DY000_02012776 [Brassica cretica]